MDSPIAARKRTGSTFAGRDGCDSAPQLDNDVEYCAALDEIERLLLAEPGSAEERRLEALILGVEAYEATHDPVPDWPLVNANAARAA